MSILASERLKNEQELVKQLVAKNSNALATLYDNYSAALLGVIIRIVINQDLAEEVLQDSFLKIWNKIDSYSSEKGRLYSWMHRIARNLALDKLRSKEVSKMKATDALENKASKMIDSKNNYESNLFSEDILKYLNENQAHVIKLMYFHGYTGEDIAKESNIPLGTVKSRVRSALKKLRSIYGIE